MYKILVIGYDLLYQPIQTFISGFKKRNDEVDFISVSTDKRILLKSKENEKSEEVHQISQDNRIFKTPIEIDGSEYDYVLIGNSHLCFKILNNDRIVYYHSEKTWYPSCINPTFLFSPFPEFENYFARYYPNVIESVKAFKFINYPICKDHYRNIPKKENLSEESNWLNFQMEKKRKEGLFYMGNLFTSDTKTWRMRTIYDFKIKIIGLLKEKGLLQLLPTDYNGKYSMIMQNWSYGLVVNGLGCYNSYRPYEYAINGVIPVFILKENDFYRENKFLESQGFIDELDCYIIQENELDQIYTKIRHKPSKFLIKYLLELAWTFNVKFKIKEIENIIFNNNL